MSRIVELCLALCLLATAAFAPSETAQAHSPYISLLERIVLLDGREAEILLLHGDGVVTGDPIRAIIVDSQNRILAKSHHSQVMTLICSPELRCHAFDGSQGMVLEPDPASFRTDAAFPPHVGRDVDRDQLWKIESGEESWGFRSRKANWAEWFKGELALALSLRAVLPAAFTGLAGTLVGFALLTVFRRFPNKAGVEYWLDMGLRILLPILLLPIATGLMLFAAVLGGVTMPFLIGTFFLGVLFVLSIKLAPIAWRLASVPNHSGPSK